MRTLSVLCLLGLLGLSAQVMAVIETYEFSAPELEQRYRELSAELRCPKCQNQNIADSNAPIAQDLRKLLYEQLEQGASDEEILDYMVQRYGEFVRYRPRFGGATMVLWMAPVVLLVLGFLLVVLLLRSRASQAVDDREAIGPEEQARLAALLDEPESRH